MICHHYKCIFVHIPKNAGQSIETVFLNLLGLNWKTRAPLLLRENPLPELGPHRLAHLKATEYLSYKYISQELFDSYFKFAFVRNPWARMVSFYKYLKLYHLVSFQTFVDMACHKDLNKFESWYNWFVSPQYDFLCDESGDIIVNYIGRVEYIQEDFDYVCQRLNIAATEVPCLNTSKKTPIKRLTPYSFSSIIKSSKCFLKYHRFHPYPIFKSYLDYYDKKSRLMVGDFYRKDIEKFGYQFDNDNEVSPRYIPGITESNSIQTQREDV